MRDLGAVFAEMRLHGDGELLKHRPRLEAVGCGQLHGSVEPAEQCFAFGVDVVIHLHHVAGDLLGVGDAAKPIIQAGAIARGNLQHLGIGKFLCELGLKCRQCTGFHEIGFVDDDEVCFFELFAVNINDLLRKLPTLA